MSEPNEPTTEPTPSPASPKGLSNLTLRLLTAAVGIPIILWMLYPAPAVVFALTGLVVSAIGARELATMTMTEAMPLKVWLVLASVTTTGVITFTDRADVLLTLIFGIVLSGALMVLARPDPISAASGRMGWLIAGPMYVGGAVAAIAKLHQLEDGGSWVVLSMMLAWGSDTGGYFAGRAFGRRKLYEKVSPKKTVEGSIGGLVTVVGFALFMTWLALPKLRWGHAVALALVAGAVGQAGDLCISVIKRSTGVKDSGNLIPGHGGLLDRIDALMFTAVVTLLYAHWVLELPSELPPLGF
jgi:phosphatidate cytidylyltransferase